MLRDQGYQPGIAECRVELAPVEQRIAALFDLSPDARVLHISRTRLANGHPAVYSDEYLPESVLGPESMVLQSSTEDWSLYARLHQAGVEIAFATCKVVPVVADEALATRLRIQAGHPLLLLKQLHFTAVGQPVLYCENYHNSAFIEFQTVRKA
jgi:GntR family transcriptional regulator